MQNINVRMTGLHLGQDEIGVQTAFTTQQDLCWSQYQSDYQGHLQWQAQHDAHLRESVEVIHQWQTQQDVYR